MNFRPELAEAVMAGTKTVTRRLVSENERSPWWVGGCRYKPGQRFTVNPGRGKVNIGYAVVTAVRGPVPISHLSDEEARREGFADAAAFEAGFAAINGVYDPAAKVYVISVRPEWQRPCGRCGDDGWVELIDEETLDTLDVRNCPDLDEPWHAPFNATQILPEVPIGGRLWPRL